MEQSRCRYWATRRIQESSAFAKGSWGCTGTQEDGTGGKADGHHMDPEREFFFLDLLLTGLAYSPQLKSGALYKGHIPLYFHFQLLFN
jgi:hypothetical protein